MNILLIDKRVQDYETIVAAIDPALAVGVVFDYYEDTFETVKTRMRELGLTNSTNQISVGLIQHNYKAPMFNMLASADVAPVAQVATQDPDLAAWTQFRDFITWCKTELNTAHFDLMACALYSDPDWKYVIDTLTAQTGVTVRASTDDTGAASLGGDWFLESHTGVNLKTVYFTQAIDEYRGLLLYTSWGLGRPQQQTKALAVGVGVTWGTASYGGLQSGLSNIVAVYSSLGDSRAFAALKSDGGVIAWGDPAYGGNSSSVASSLSSGVVTICCIETAFAALKSNGSVVSWGTSNGSTTITPTSGSATATRLSSGVIALYATRMAFSALKSDGSVVSWGEWSRGGDQTFPSNVTANLTSGVIKIFSNFGAFVALKSNGSVVVWGDPSWGGNITSVASLLTSGVVAVYPNGGAFAALKTDGSVVTWGNTSYGANSSSVSSQLSSNVVSVWGTQQAFAALKRDGSVVAWGNAANGGSPGSAVTGGNTSSVAASLTSGVVMIYSNWYAFAALKRDGSVITWGGNGGNQGTTASALTSGVVAIYSNWYNFAALKSNGSVVTWDSISGTSFYGGNSSSVSSQLTANIVAVYQSSGSFAALTNAGKVITWPPTYDAGGNSSTVTFDISSNVVNVYANREAYVALRSSETTFDLNKSYYTDMDRYDILRNKNNRRRANLTTLNNNVFTLSTARDIIEINPNIPTTQPLRIIVPAYASSSSHSYSTSATITSDLGSVIIACEEGELVEVSGTTYVNYGSFVYTLDASGTYVQTTSRTLNDVPYSLYGGDGLLSSGIVFVDGRTVPTLGSSPFVVASDKTFGDASFNITTAPTSDSSGAIVYSSSNPAVATIDASGNFINVVGGGTVYFIATQLPTTQYASAVKNSNTLTVALATTSLSSLSVAASKTFGAVPFSIDTAPTSASSGAITYSSNATGVATINPSSGIITLVAAGTVTFTASQAASSQYAAPTPVTSNTLTVSKGTTSLTSFSVATVSNTVNALNFDGVNDGINYGLPALMTGSTGTQFRTTSTLECWFKHPGAPQDIYPVLMARNYSGGGTTDQSVFSVDMYNNKVRLYFTTMSGASSIESINTYADSTWHHTAVSYNGQTGEPKLYIDGVLVSSYANPALGLLSDSTNSSTNFRVGDGRTDWNEMGYRGSIAEVRVWNIIRTPTEIYDNYLKQLGGNENGLILYNRLDQGTANGSNSGINTTTNNMITGGYTGTLENFNLSGSISNWVSGPPIAVIGLKTFGAVPFSITAPTSASSGAITYSSNATGVATINPSSGIITLVAAGTATFTASQVESAQYNAPTSVTSNPLIVALGTTSLTSFSVAGSKTFEDAPFSITAPTSASSGAITYSSNATGVATINPSSGIITLVASGTATFTASQAASAQYNAPTPVTSNTLTVSRGASDFSGSTFLVASNKRFGDASFNIATAPTSIKSDGAITYSSSNPAVATIDTSGNFINLVGGGTVYFIATQLPTAQYASSVKNSNTLAVALGTTSLTSFSVAGSKTFGAVPFSIDTAPTSDSSGAITYSSNATGVATINPSSGIITLVAAGTATFTASQAESAQYESPTPVTSNTLTVARGTTSLTSFSVAESKTFGAVPFSTTTTPTSDSSGAITYSSNATGVAIINPSSGIITLVAAGTATFTASQAESAQYNAPTPVTSNTLTVSKVTPTLVFVSPPTSKSLTDAAFTVTATSGILFSVSNSGSGAYVINSSSNPTLSVIRGMRYILSVNASGHPFWIQTVSGAYSSGNVYSTIANNGQDVGTIVWEVALDTPNTLYYACQFHSSMQGTINVADGIGPTGASSGAITYTSSNTERATVGLTTGLVTLVDTGSVTITAAQAASSQYNAPTNTTFAMTIGAPTNLAGTVVTTSLASKNLTGISLVGTNLANISLANTNLRNADLSGATITGASFINTDISGATNLPVFSTKQKLQLLRNANNAAISAVQISTPLSGAEINAAITTPIPDISGATFVVKAPAYNVNNEKVVAVTAEEMANNESLYIPMNSGETVKVNGVAYTFNGTNILNSSGSVIQFINVLGKPFRLYAGSIVGLNVADQLNNIKLNGDGLYEILTGLFAAKT